jgi:CDP-diacylglycerol--glycerol-3-phosphate 3-phosphatidyltransferase/cardiolipin synthase
MEGTGATEGRQATAWFRPPDALSVFRIPLAGLFILVTTPSARFTVLAVTALSDLLDGPWARRMGGSRFGAFLDPFCDKVFMATAFFAVIRADVLPPLEIVGVLIRDIMAAAAFVGSIILRRPTSIPARAGGKAVTWCQMLTLTAFVAESDLLRPLAWATAAISVYAIADYGRVAWRLQ